MKRAKAAGKLLLRVIARWRRDNVDRLAAALAYYSMFSLAPLLMLGVAISNALQGSRRTTRFVSELAQLTLGDRGVQVIKPVLESAPRPHAVTLATVIGLLTMLYGASNLFVHLQAALNSIWEAPAGGKHWLRT